MYASGVPTLWRELTRTWGNGPDTTSEKCARNRQIAGALGLFTRDSAPAPRRRSEDRRISKLDERRGEEAKFAAGRTLNGLLRDGPCRWDCPRRNTRHLDCHRPVGC